MDQMEGRYRDSVNMLLGKIAHMSYSMMFQEAKNLGIIPARFQSADICIITMAAVRKRSGKRFGSGLPPSLFPSSGWRKTA